MEKSSEPKPKVTSTKRINKKIKKEKNFKNVIVLPYERYWPLLDSEEDAKELIHVLKSVLSKLRSEQLDLPAYGSFGKTKEEKLKYKNVVREKREASQYFQQQKELRSELCVGVNSVARGLESGKVCVCLVAADCDPTALVSHLLHSSGASSTPALVLPSLKQLSREVAGFSCLALAIKKEPKNSELELLVKEVSRLSSQYPLTESLKILSSSLSPPVATPPVTKTTPVIDPSKYHLKRPSNSERAFVPGNKPLAQPEDFISLGTAEVSLGKVEKFAPLRIKKQKNEPGTYHPLKVKKIQPNPNKKVKKVNKGKK